MLLLREIQRVLDVGASQVLGLAVTLDGREFLTAGFDGVHRWELATGKRLCTYRDRPGCVCWSVACTRSQDLVLAGFGDLTLWLWDFGSGKELRQFVGHAGIVTAVAFSPDGKRSLSSSPDKSLRVWDTMSGHELINIEGKKSFCWRNAYAPTGGQFAAAGYDKTVTLYAAADGRLLHTLTGHTGWVEAIAFSPDGTQVASAGRDKTVRVRSVRGGKAVHCLTAGKKMLQAVVYTADGQYVLAGDCAGIVRAWELKTGAQAAEVAIPMKADVASLAVSPLGDAILAGCGGGKVVIWEKS
jgi:WD40 repeat protein